MTRLALVLAYDGTDFLGWQRQAEGRSVQGELEAALQQLLDGRVVAEGASRTDTGVHAHAQVAHLDVPAGRLSAADLRWKLNAVLPPDVRLRAIVPVDDDFDARRSARGKLYTYSLHVAPMASPFTRRWRLHVRRPLDVRAMAEAAGEFVGMRDFASLQTSGSDVRTSIREIVRCEVTGREPELDVHVEGTGFLRHMVRALVGSLLDVGRGKRQPAWIPDMLAQADRGAAGANAPAHGLALRAVRYGPPHDDVLAAALAAESRFRRVGSDEEE